MTVKIRTIENPSPEQIRTGDYITLHRIGRGAGGRSIQVRGTVYRWGHIMADWLTLAGWPNQRFTIDGQHAQWTVSRVEREEPVESEAVPFITGHATVTRRVPGERRDVTMGHREHGIYLAGRFYPIGADGRPLTPGPWTDFVADAS